MPSRNHREGTRPGRAGARGAAITRRTVLLGGVGAAVAAALPASASPPCAPAKKRFQDPTHVFTEGFPVFTFDPPARETLVTIPGGGFYAQKWTFGEHSGTHMDAPGHFVVGENRPFAPRSPQES